MTIVIVGGVAGGASAAARLRRLGEGHEIVLFERGRYISFANCGLPYHIGGQIEERDSLLVQTAEGMERRFHIDIRTETEVSEVDPGRSTVKATKLRTGEVYEQHYDRLLLSPGAAPVRPPIPGINSHRILALRNMEDMDRIMEQIAQTGVRRAVVVGGGFIGIEIAENLGERGIAPVIVEQLDQVLPMVDREMAAKVHQHLKEHGIGLYLSDGVTSFKEEKNAVGVELESGSTLTADIVILAIGVRPETNLARSAGLEIGTTGGIKVNAYLQTSNEHIFAVGDAVEVTHYISGKPVLIPLAWPANRQGRIVAGNMIGASRTSYNGTLGTSILQVFDLTVASVGLNEKQLQSGGLAYGRDYQVVTIERENHAAYYPGALPLTLKLIFTSEGTILGAQSVGYAGVDKRIDVIATAIKGGLSVHDLQDIELAYAPPYNSAKDPVNIAGYAAENLLQGLVTTFRWYELDRLLDREETVLLDVRSEEEYALGAIPGAINIDIDQLRGRIGELIRAKEYLVYCRVGQRGYLAARLLNNAGIAARNLDGGYELWYALSLRQDNRVDFETLNS